MSDATWEQRIITSQSKYQVVANQLAHEQGTLLDVGSRDKILSQYLDTNRIAYRSAELDGDADHHINLEQPIQLPDGSFDFVVALDVLEHVENLHQAFGELSRITRHQLFIALPCMSSLPRRLNYFLTGRLGTGKYDLMAQHQGDRHRWLTVYDQINPAISSLAAQSGLHPKLLAEEIEVSSQMRPWKLPLLIPARILSQWKLVPRGAFVGRCTFCLVRR